MLKKADCETSGTTDCTEALVCELERKIVEHCAPTLLNLKPASLFTFCCKVADDKACAPRPGGCESNASCRRATRRRRFPSVSARELDSALDACARKLAPRGIRLRVLTRCANGPIVYIYRPGAIERTLARPEVAALLSREGYHPGTLDAHLDHLSKRLVESLPSHDGHCEFPHEIGLFLGYPFEDVVAFIDNDGRDFLCLGCWKAYHDVAGAQRMWAAYGACTAHCKEMIGRGMALECIAVPGTLVEAIGILPMAV